MKKFLLIFGCILIVSFANAQTPLEKADQSFAIGDYTFAIKDYQKAFKSEKEPQAKSKIAYKIGVCYKEKNLLSSSKDWFNKALELGYNNPNVYLKLGDVFVFFEDYAEAIKNYKKYLEAEPNDSYSQKQIVSCQYAIENLDKTANYTIRNEATLNTDKGEYGVAFFPMVAIFGNAKNGKKEISRKVYEQQYRNELEIKSDILYIVIPYSKMKDRIVFTSNRQIGGLEKTDAITGQGNDNIFEALFDASNDKWMKIVPLSGSITSTKNEGFFSYCERDKVTYFSKYNNVEGKAQQIGNIFSSKYNDITNTWDEPVIFPYNSNSYDVVHPTVTTDGNTLYFASNMEGGFGGYDLYVIERDSNKVWGQPVNLGPTINTAYNELFPFIYKKNELYFTSTGHPGFGGQDVFVSFRQKDKSFNTPKNMGKPINSSSDDFGIITEISMDNMGNEIIKGYFSSNRRGADAKNIENDDVYSFKKVVPTISISGNVKEKNKKNVSNVRVIIKGDTKGFYDVTLSDENGNFIFTGLDASDTYQWSVDDDQYISEVKTVDPKDTTHTPKDTTTKTPVISNKNGFDTNIKVIKVSKKEIPINNIYYDYGKADLRFESTKELDTLASILMGNYDKYIVINSYTDAQSSDEFNYYLSQRRAQKVVDYLISKGLPREKYFAMGYGESNLIKKNAVTEDEHQLNRRTTFKVLTEAEYKKHIANASKFNPAFKRYGSQEMPDWVKKIFDGTSVSNENNNNKTSNNTTITNTTSDAVGLEYRVQFIAVKSPVNAIYYKRIEDAIAGVVIKNSLGSDNIYRYYVANNQTIEEANRTQKKLMEIGFESVIFPYYNGERISFSKAKTLINK